MRAVLLVGALIGVAVVACAASNEYEVVVPFTTEATQEEIDEVGDLLRSYDADVDFLIQESFPPTGRAVVETDVPSFCRTVLAELEGREYLRGPSCERR
jgi:hypothetical protein